MTSKRKTSHKIILTSLSLGAVLAVTRPAVLGKVYAANQYDWTKLNDVDPLGGYYSSAARSADGSTLILSVEDGGEQAGDPEDWVESPLYISSNGGATWQNVADEVDPGMEHEWTAVDVSDDGQVMVAVSESAHDIDGFSFEDGKVFVSEDGGDTWADKTPADEEDWNDVAVSGDGSTIATTRWNSDIVFVSENGGDTWDNQAVDDVDEDIWNLKSVSLSDNGNKILVGGENTDGDDYTRLYLSNDGGANWSDISPSPEEDAIHGISHDMSADGTHIIASTMGWADGGNDAVYFSDNSGSGWENVTPEAEDEESNYWTASAISDDGSRIAIMDDEENGKMYTSGNDGSSWTEEDPGQDYEDENLWWQAVDFNEDGSKAIVVSEDNAYISGILTAPTVTLSDAEGGKTITITTPAGTTITCHSAVKESSLDAKDGAYSYPLGLVDFCFSTSEESNEVSLAFVTDLKPNEVIARKYNPNTKKYTTITDASITETTVDGKHALLVTYTIVDNGPLDADPDEGEIADPVGLATAVGAPNSGLGGAQNTRQSNVELLTSVVVTTGLLTTVPLSQKIQNRTSSKK